MKRIWAFAPLVLLLFLAAAIALSLFSGGARKSAPTATQAGQQVPAATLARLDGEAFNLAQLQGQTYVINLFASWCAPCRQEHPLLLALAQEGVPIIGVAYKDKPADTKAFLAELGDPYAIALSDPQGALALQLGFSGVPETFVVGPDGRVRASVRRPLDEQSLAQIIRPALTESASP